MEEKVQRLSEGMDFLEEALGYGEPLEYTEVSESIISESNDSNPSPYRILGRCSGNFQPIGEFSRNKRLYSENLWPTILQNEELKSRLAHRAVFGCLGHADKLVDDRDIQEGKVSHIVTKLEVRKDKNTGKPFLYGELEILDTPAGRILEAMYRGGADLYVSSRAAGKLFPVPGQDYSLIKPEQYVMHTFDIVCRPGFIKARPMFEAVKEDASISESQTEQKEEIKENLQPSETSQQSSEANTIAELNNKINQLTKIIEKVVDDVYEEEAPTEEQPVEESQPSEPTQQVEEAKTEPSKDEKKKEALPAFIQIMAESNISEEAFSEILDMIKGGLN